MSDWMERESFSWSVLERQKALMMEIVGMAETRKTETWNRKPFMCSSRTGSAS